MSTVDKYVVVRRGHKEKCQHQFNNLGEVFHRNQFLWGALPRPVLPPPLPLGAALLIKGGLEAACLHLILHSQLVDSSLSYCRGLASLIATIAGFTAAARPRLQA
jgi:hypothetical protein